MTKPIQASPRYRESPADKDDEEMDWAALWAGFAALRQYYRLLSVMTCVCFVFSVLVYALLTPMYTATAIIGPPAPSPTGTMLATAGSTGPSGLAGRVLSGNGIASSSDPYQEMLQLLPSSRLAEVLSKREYMLQRVFYNRWDFSEQRWKPTGFAAVINPIKRMLHRPTAGHPGVGDLAKYLSTRLTVGRSGAGGSSTFLPGVASYMVVTFDYENADDAENMLDVILQTADQIVREDQRRDVVARISFLKKALADATVSADERTALISILSYQVQLLAMIEADHRYASTLVVTPFASPKPTSPTPPLAFATLALLFCLIGWISIVIWAQHNERVRMSIERFRRYDELPEPAENSR